MNIPHNHNSNDTFASAQSSCQYRAVFIDNALFSGNTYGTLRERQAYGIIL
jgi:hypothetical protein